jgi:hypothetical protein
MPLAKLFSSRYLHGIELHALGHSAPLILSLQNIFQIGDFRPQVPQLDRYGGNFCDTNQVFEGGMDPTVWFTNNTDAANP